MARYWFGGTAADGVYSTYTLGDRQLLTLARTTLRFYDAEVGGNQYTDLLTESGVAVSEISTELGQVPRFRGPDGITEMWADDGDNVRTRMVAYDAAALFDAVAQAETAATTADTAATDASSSATSAQTAADAAADYAAAAQAGRWALDPADSTVLVVTPGDNEQIDPADPTVLIVTV